MSENLLPIATPARTRAVVWQMVRPHRRLAVAALAVLVVGTAVGLATAPLLGRIVGNMILGSNRTSVPVRLFPNEAAALAWLEEQELSDSGPRSR